MTTLIKCPNPECGHRFPINLKRHTNRRERFCPRCRTQIIIRRRFSFKPNPKWLEEKQEQAETRARIKEMAKPPSQRSQMPKIDISQIPFINMLLESLRMKKALEEKQKNEPT